LLRVFAPDSNAIRYVTCACAFLHRMAPAVEYLPEKQPLTLSALHDHSFAEGLHVRDTASEWLMCDVP
jgi:hypothetical protein